MTRKSLKDISWLVTEPEYRADSAYSYSTLSTYLSTGFSGIKGLFDKKSSPSLTFGSMVDTLLTDGEEAFYERFEVNDFPEISDQLSQIARTLFSIYGDTCSSLCDIPDEFIGSVAADCGYYKNPRYANTRIKNVKEGCAQMYDLLTLSKGKELVSNSEYMKAFDCVSEIRNNPKTMFYFAANTDPDIERLYQLKFKGEYEGIKLRCMADLIIVNHKTKTIIPCDLKTSSDPEYEFEKAFIKWHYWIQAQLYWYLIRQNMDKDEVFKDYKLDNYRFIVINKELKSPVVWNYSDTRAITDCTYGRNNDILCRNWRGIVKELDKYLKENPKYPEYINESVSNSLTERLNKL